MNKPASPREGQLPFIREPAALRTLSMQQMEALAGEIRTHLIESVSKTGGHLASNLGVVELTLALHRVFQSPEDRIVWDVGHQTYVHKMLTGRLSRMHRLKCHEGLSGFPKREESPHDAFNTGHSSTSISAALGMARARDLLGQQHRVVAVIGDGALTGGMALEALNDAGMAGTDLLVILNDNGMSIARNVGGMSRYLSLLRTRPVYYRTREFVERITERLPKGRRVRRFLRRVKTSLKSMLVPSLLFEDLGFRYFGPVDGHNLPDLVRLLEQTREMHGPLLLHVRTQKGKGYRFAERKPDVFHGTSPFEVETGSPLRCSTGTWSEWFGEAMVTLADERADVVAITAAMPDGTGLVPLKRQHPSRVLDVGIAEQHAVTLAAGLAAGGIRPVVAIYSTFLQRAYDQVLHDVCLQRLPVILAVDRAGVVGDDGETHQGIYDLAFLLPMPGLTILAPATGTEVLPMLRFALEKAEGPVAIRYPRGCAEVVQQTDEPLENGKALLLRDGADCTLVAVGALVPAALEAAEVLFSEGISCAVVHARFVKPFDHDMLLRMARQTRHILTAEDGVVSGGFGAAVLQWAADSDISCNTRTLGYPDIPITQDTRASLLARYGLDAAGLAASVRHMLQKGDTHGQKEA